MSREEFSPNERRLIEANTTLVDKNKNLMEDLKRLSAYVLRPEECNKNVIIALATYYDEFTYY